EEESHSEDEASQPQGQPTATDKPPRGLEGVQASINTLIGESRSLQERLLEGQRCLVTTLTELMTELRGSRIRVARSGSTAEREEQPKRRKECDTPHNIRELIPKSVERAAAKEVSRLKLTQCGSKAELMLHIDYQERILTSYGMGDYTAAEGEFEPYPELEVLVLGAFAESLQDVGLKSEVHDWVRDQSHPRWEEMRAMIKWRFCRRHHLQSYFHQQVAAFKCENSSRVEEFLREVRKAYNLLQSVYQGDVSELKAL
ncbi:hypothetical protein FOL47_004431, partial [Perkinsus chesapeaki]